VEAAAEIVGDEIDLQESDGSSGSTKDEDKSKTKTRTNTETRKKTKVAGALKELALDPMAKRTEDTPLAIASSRTSRQSCRKKVFGTARMVSALSTTLSTTSVLLQSRGWCLGGRPGPTHKRQTSIDT
jgi:hypothetical protein